MKNFEKFKTARERHDAFLVFCRCFKNCKGCPIQRSAINERIVCHFLWLDLEIGTKAGATAQWEQNIMNKFTNKE